MKYAVVKTGGKQYRVSEGDQIEVEHLPYEAGKEFQFDNSVLLSVVDGKVEIGMPFVNESTVKAVVVGHKRGEKLYVSQYKAKARYRRRIGHRQELSVVKIKEIIEKGAHKASVQEQKDVKKPLTKEIKEKSAQKKVK